MSLGSNSANGYSHTSGQTTPKIVSLATAKAVDPVDAQMDQIRDLLFGEFKREIDLRMAAFEARIVDLERRLAAARAEDETRRRSMLDEIARGVTALGDHVKQISR